MKVRAALPARGWRKIADRWNGMSRAEERLFVWTFFAALVFGVLALTGTLTSGFHLVDDWEYAKYVDLMSPGRSNFAGCLKDTLEFDLTVRFRPLYYINRVCAAAVFGVNLTSMSVWKGMEIVAALAALYYCARHMRCSRAYSLLFALTVMVGYQSAVWWKLGPQESYGMLLFATGFYLLLTWLEGGGAWRAAGSAFLFFLMSLYKESFILLLPFVLLYVLYAQMRGRERLTAASLWESVRAKWGYLLVLGLLFTAEMLLLLFVIGTNNYEYIGLDAQMTYEQYREVWLNALGADLKWYFRFGVICCMILLTYWEELKKLGWEMALTALLIVPQIVTYSKTGITERYLLPTAFGIAFWLIAAGGTMKALGGRRKSVYVLCLLLMLAAHTRVMLREADYFAYRGGSVQTMLDTTLEYTREHPGTKVLACFAPNAEGNRTMYYWLRIHGYDDVFYWDEDRKLISKWFGEHEDEEDVLEHMDVVVMYNREDRHWCYEPSLDLSDFEEHRCGTLTMYFRKDG